MHVWKVNITHEDVEHETALFLEKGGVVKYLPDGPEDWELTYHWMTHWRYDRITAGVCDAVNKMAGYAQRHREWEDEW